MTSGAVTPARRQALYYPFFHVRNDAWLKLAALYWPRIVRIAPDGYTVRDSSVAEQLIAETGFIRTVSPTPSVEPVSRIFQDLIADHGHALRERFSSDNILAELRADLATMHPEQFSVSAGPDFEAALRSTGTPAPPRPSRQENATRFTVLHRSQVTPELVDQLVDSRLAAVAEFAPHPKLRGVGDEMFPVTDTERVNWLVADRRLVSAYCAVFAEDYAAANHLTAATDQHDAFSIATGWSTDALAHALIGGRYPTPADRDIDSSAAHLALLALALVVPENLGSIPVSTIIGIRSKYGDEFAAFGELVEVTAASLSETLPAIRDRVAFDSYLEEVLARTFAQPVAELKAMLRGLRIDAATLSINVKSEVPAGVVLAGGTWLAGHPVLAGATGIGIGIVGVGRTLQKERRDALRASPGASYLLHLEQRLSPMSLLQRAMAPFGGITRK